MKNTIPVVHCFDNNYCIPAAVAFYSMLKHANPAYFYKLYVLHEDISGDNQSKLKQTIAEFTNADLTFIDSGTEFQDEWEKLKIKGHFSKEMFQKLTIASKFDQYDKVIVSDVDVVYLGDISSSYIAFDENDVQYLGVVKVVGKILFFLEQYKDKVSEEDFKKLTFGAGYMIMNLKKIRQDNLEKAFIDKLKQCIDILIQPEQDVLSYVVGDRVKFLPLANMVCSYVYYYYNTEAAFKNDEMYSENELKQAMDNPIQLHYATNIKPWNNPACIKSEEWFKMLAQTPFLQNWLTSIDKKINSPLLYKERTIFSLKLNAQKTLSVNIRKNVK